MSNPTTPFGWQMPTNTDLVTDLPADFEVFGQAVATSMADLLGGTTGQILSKATNADMDFTWVDNQVGDITSITATTPLTGGGTGGDVTVGIQAASTTQSGAVQLTDSTSSTSTTTAATPNSVKTTYDLANGAIPKSTVTNAGDVIYATGSGAVTRLSIGSAGQVLTVNGGGSAPSWATPASSPTGLTYITGGTFTSASTIALSAGALTSTYKNYVVVFNVNSTSAGQNLLLQLNESGAAKSGASYYGATKTIGFSSDTTSRSAGSTSFRMGSTYDATFDNAALTLEIYNCGSSEYVGFAGQGFLYGAPGGEVGQTSFGGYYLSKIVCDGFTITTSTGNVTGFYRVYGRNQS